MTRIAVTLSLLFLLCTYESVAQPNVRVISDQATIYSEPNANSSHQIDVLEGDFFELEEVRDEWMEINLFSGSPWYIKRSLVEPAYIIPPYPSDPSLRKAVCKQTGQVKRRASKKAISKFSGKFSGNATMSSC